MCTFCSAHTLVGGLERMAVQQGREFVQSVGTVPLVEEQVHRVKTLSSPEHAWVTLLETLPYQRQGRVFYGLMFKRWCDLVFAVVLLVVLSPLFLLVGLAVWLDSGGPVIYTHQRVGWHGKLFTMYKFRTMIGDRRVQQQLFGGPDRRRSHKTRHDPRVTRLGRLLRATSIDELPQFWNVLRGDMSFIGPRPELPHIVERYAPWQHQRHLVRPGLSGWWQVQGRSDRPMHEHTELDLYYVEHQSLALDVQILVRTARALLLRSGAF